jgi:hypothetical protein
MNCLPKDVRGKSIHTLLKKNSIKNCFYLEKSNAYSCAPYKCDEPLVNEKKPDVSNLACRYITEFATDDCISGLVWLEDENFINTFPEKHCKVIIEQTFVNIPGGPETIVVDFEDRQISIISDPSIPGFYVGPIIYRVNGVECFRCSSA